MGGSEGSVSVRPHPAIAPASQPLCVHVPRAPGCCPSAQVLACDVTLGYEDVYNVQLLRFNGQPVSNLAQLAAAVRQALQQEAAAAAAAAAAAGESQAGSGGAGGGGYLRFDLDYNEVVVVEARGEFWTLGCLT
jgi:hypothetical protein